MTDHLNENESDLFQKVFMDGKWELDPSLIVMQKWCSVVVRGFPDLIQCEWISDALNLLGTKQVVYLTRGGESVNDKSYEVGSIDTASIAKQIFYKGPLCLAVTTKELDFVLFKDVANEYYILSGSEEIMNVAYRATFTTAKMMFFGDLEYEKESTKKGFRTIWNAFAVPCSK